MKHTPAPEGPNMMDLEVFLLSLSSFWNLLNITMVSETSALPHSTLIFPSQSALEFSRFWLFFLPE